MQHILKPLSSYIERVTDYWKDAIEEKKREFPYRIERLIEDGNGYITGVRIHCLANSFVCPLLTPENVYNDKNMLQGLNPIEASIITEIVTERKFNNVTDEAEYFIQSENISSDTITIKNINSQQAATIPLSNAESNSLLNKLKTQDIFRIGKLFGARQESIKRQKFKSFLSKVKNTGD